MALGSYFSSVFLGGHTFNLEREPLPLALTSSKSSDSYDPDEAASFLGNGGLDVLESPTLSS